MRLLLALPLCIFPLQPFLNAFFLLTLHTSICRISSYRLPSYFAILMLLCERSNLIVIYCPFRDLSPSTIELRLLRLRIVAEINRFGVLERLIRTPGLAPQPILW